MPTTRPGTSSPRATAVIDSDDVLDASTQSCDTMASRSRISACLTPRFSTMASITSAESRRSASAVATLSRPRAVATSSGVSLPLSASLASVAISCSAAAAAAPSRTSNRCTGWPASKATCTMPTPITPAPITATGRLRNRLSLVMPGILSRYAPVQAPEGTSLDNDEVVTFLSRHCRPRGRVARGVGLNRSPKPPCGRHDDSTGGPSAVRALRRSRDEARPPNRSECELLVLPARQTRGT